MRHWALMAVAVAGLGLAGLGALRLAAPDRGDDAPLGPGAVNVAGADIGGPFVLTSHTGQRLTQAEVVTGPTLIYFGYTFCPDICPVDVALMLEAVDLLAAKGVSVRPVFITIDPNRDTVAALAEYVAAMDPKLLALTGSDVEIAAAAKAYKVYYENISATNSNAEYLVNHTAFTYFMMPDGIAALFRRGHPAADMAAEIARVMAARGLAQAAPGAPAG